jgi:hypothetical protein
MNVMTTETTYYDVMVEDMLGFGSLRSLQPESIIRIGSILMHSMNPRRLGRLVFLERNSGGWWSLLPLSERSVIQQQVRICFGYTFLSTKIADGP